MIFLPTRLKDAYLIQPEPREDPRGCFARVWCEQEFAAQGLAARMRQGNYHYTARQGTIRGLHYQVAPYQEAKLIRCTAGAIYDVIIDLRRDSPTYGQWLGVELSAEKLELLYVPEGFAHGYQSLEDRTEFFYLVSECYTPAAEAGIRYDDPAFGIAWPLEVSVVSEKDRTWADFDLAGTEQRRTRE